VTQKLILHPATAQQFEALAKNPAHAIAILGARGSGKHALATALAAHIMTLKPEALEKYPYFMRLQRAEPSISIGQIRELQHFTQLKTTGSGDIRRVILIADAGRLTTEAQNALLKLLEEPPEDTVLLLTVENTHGLLPTIMSRMQTLTVHAAPGEAVREHFLQHFEASAVDKAYFLSGGSPGLMQALLQNEQSHPLFAAVAQAKEILQKPMIDRLVLADGLSKKKDDARTVVQALRQIAEVGLAQAANQQNTDKLRRWHGVVKGAYQAEEALANNANTKLVLTNLMLAL